jgi:cytochrome P450
VVDCPHQGPEVPQIDLMDAEVLGDPLAAYGRVREQGPLARLSAPGMGTIWAVTRHEDAKALLGDQRFVMNAAHVADFDAPNLAEEFRRSVGVPEECLIYLRTMSDKDGPAHSRLRSLVSRAFSARRAAGLRPQIERLAEGLLDDLPGKVEGGAVDLLPHFARPLPIEVIGALVGTTGQAGVAWRKHSAALSAGLGPAFGEAVRGVVEGVKAVISLRRQELGDDLVSDLLRAQAEDGDRLSDTELVTMVVHLVVAGQENPANLIANSIAALLTHPEQLAVLREDSALMPRAVEELMRWSSPLVLTQPRYAKEDVEIGGTVVRKGELVTAAIAGANRDPRAYAAPDSLDTARGSGAPNHLALGHGPHYCLGASLAQVQTEVALTTLLSRFPELGLAVEPGELQRVAEPGSWRLATLPVTL